jgi:ribulose-5-phosphate 4-epimerase/fuculose-1-phosphate aldolase
MSLSIGRTPTLRKKPSYVRQEMSEEQRRELHRTLITANHILHHHGVLDAYGHVSARHPTKPDMYIMARETPPALIESSDDLLEYWILDSQPVKETDNVGYKERFIHGEIYKRFHEVQCVIHSHDDNVMPFATSGVPFMPVFHMAGFLGELAWRYENKDLSIDGLIRTKCARL